MPNVAAVLRAEIQRLARKEVKSQVQTLQKRSADQRRTLAALRRQIAGLEREVARLRKRSGGSEAARAATAPKPVRFSPGWVASDRERLGLSARDYGRLVGVAALTIYNWEKGKSKPRARQLAAWGAIRGIGKREAHARLERPED